MSGVSINRLKFRILSEDASAICLSEFLVGRADASASAADGVVPLRSSLLLGVSVVDTVHMLLSILRPSSSPRYHHRPPIGWRPGYARPDLLTLNADAMVGDF